MSDISYGLSGYSENYIGLSGQTNIGIGLFSQSNAGEGIRAISQNSIGVNSISTNNIGVRGNGATYDFYAAGSGINYGPFTGAHEFTIDKNSKPLPGMILSVVYTRVRKDFKNKEFKHNLSTTFPHLKIAEQGETAYCIFNFAHEFKDDDKNLFFDPDENHLHGAGNALGEGWLLATDRNGVPKKGDILTISEIPGYAEVIEGYKHMTIKMFSSILCKVIDNIDFADAENIPGTIYKRKLVPVIYMMG